MTIENSFDLFLYIAMLVDLGFKYYRIYKIKKIMPKWQHYQKDHSIIKKYGYLFFMMCNIVYIIYRLYSITFNDNYNFNELALIFPIILYYIIFDYCISGIYFNGRSIYYKQELINYSSFIHSYRVKEGNYYVYSITYRTDKTGSRDIEIKIKDEIAAYGLLSSIPFKEMHE